MGIFGSAEAPPRARQDQSNQVDQPIVQGAGDHGEVWNPNGGPDGSGSWEKPNGTATIPLGNRGQGSMGAGGGYNAEAGLASFGPGATRGNLQDGDAWGNSSGAIVMGPDGKPMVDPTQDGRSRDVARFRGMGDEAAKRQAFQMNYGQGNVDRAAGQATRGQQGVATSLLGSAARGGAPSGAVIRGQGATDDSFAAALGAQAGARGGPANQAAATQAGASAARNAQLGVASHLGAARGSELTSARGAYSAGANTLRGGDYQQQALDQQRQRAGLANEMGQRELNQARQKGMEGLAFDVNVAAQNAALKKGDREAGLAATSLQRETAAADRMAAFYNKSIEQAGKMGGKALNSGGGGDDEEEKKKG